MGFEAEIILDSIAPNGVRITTMQLRYPRIVHAEMVRHRVFSRSVASSRAIPVLKQIEKIERDPFIPHQWQLNQKGMVAGEFLSEDDAKEAEKIWKDALASAVEHTKKLVEKNVHKEIANRILEPFSWTVEIVTGTYWDNFYKLRTASNAQPQIQEIAKLMEKIHKASTPKQLSMGDWHIPMLREEDESFALEEKIAISAGRCARTSYETHQGKREPNADIELKEWLVKDEHWSPLEHQATPLENTHEHSGNFQGWKQNRQIIEGSKDKVELY